MICIAVQSFYYFIFGFYCRVTTKMVKAVVLQVHIKNGIVYRELFETSFQVGGMVNYYLMK